MFQKDLVYFLQKYNVAKEDISLYPYGSRIYGTALPNSDYDFLAIFLEDRKYLVGEEFHKNLLNIQINVPSHFQERLNSHDIQALEIYFLETCDASKKFSFKLDLSKLRESISAKASHSFVKAKKKIDVEKDYLIGMKSLFHSLRILDFGTQIAQYGKIVDFHSMSITFAAMLSLWETDWNKLAKIYKPEYNRLATRFRKFAPKEEK